MILEELMINDIVQFDEEQVKVMSFENCGYCNSRIFIEHKDGSIYPTYHDNIKPIPLTKEILMNNGFRIIFEGELHTTYFQDIESFHVEIKIDCINYIKLSMSNGLGYRVIIECKYVHLLQHAFRLCGITKEIVL